MFTVKATYRNETRRFTFPDSVLFPTYNELHHQLYRIFPISHNYHLSRLVFSPDASKPGRILIGKEIHSAEEYDPRVAPLRRQWPNPLLRFTIFDETPHKVPGGGSERLSLFSTLTVPPSEVTSSPVVSRHNGLLAPNPYSFIPPPSPLPQPSAPCVVPLPPPSDVFPPSPPTCFPIASKSYFPDRGAAGTAPCCSIAKGKADVQILLSSFKEDLERILCRTFGTVDEGKPSAQNVERSTSRVSGIDVIPRRKESPVSASPNASSQCCFVCKSGFTGVWYGCIKCPWHAVCPSCFSESHSAHTLTFGPSHIVQQRSVNCSTQVSAQVVRDNTARVGASQLLAPEPLRPAGEPVLPVHHNIVCDSCSKVIVGTRHKCLDCRDYDLCTPCVESGETDQHNPFHEFFDIETPGRVYVHTVLSGDRDRSSGNSQQFSSSDHVQATRQETANISPDLLLRHSASCNLCDSPIVGERFKCVTCPDFDTCLSCFRITAEQHPNHGFVKVNKPEDLMMRDSLLFRQVAHHAVCDSCQKTIRGARFKCMHPSCPDFDLCSNCEALPIPVHPLNHPMLKLKTSDTVIPTVYRIGQTTVDEPATRKSATVSGESNSSVLFPPSPLATPTKSPEPKPIVPSDQVIDVTAEDKIPSVEEFLSPLGSPTSEVPVAPASLTVTPLHLLVDVENPPRFPQSIRPSLDIYHQLWPRVNQEMVHLNAIQVRSTGDPATKPVEDTDSEPICLESPVAEESSPESPAAPFVYEAGGHHETCQVSPVPSSESIVGGYRTPSSMPSNNQELRQSPACGYEAIVTGSAPRQSCLDSAFVGDTNVPDGQIFPPGAEFVKGWHMMNNGGLPWPTTTEVQFVTGEMFAPECSAALRAKVGVVHPGQDLDIWTGDLKAPDVPGRYVGFWRLSDGQGNFFGSSVWIDLTVADHNSDRASEQSLAASSMVMPSAHPNSVNVGDELQDAPETSLPSTKTVTDEVEEHESDISSVSLVSVPTSDDEDAEWQDTRTHSEPLEYVVLYDGNPEE